jgi:hypothetical protein
MRKLEAITLSAQFSGFLTLVGAFTNDKIRELINENLVNIKNPRFLKSKKIVNFNDKTKHILLNLSDKPDKS